MSNTNKQSTIHELSPLIFTEPHKAGKTDPTFQMRKLRLNEDKQFIPGPIVNKVN